MSDDKELADRVVALGVGCQYALPEGYSICNPATDVTVVDAAQFVRDPRVAIALMERCQRVEIRVGANNDWYATADARGKSIYLNDPSPVRAIIEAAVKALEESK